MSIHRFRRQSPVTPVGLTALPRRRRRNPTRGMKAPDALSLALASGAFATLVRYFTVRPEYTPHGRALMRETGLRARSMQQELARMERLGLVTQEHRADHRVYVRSVLTHPAWLSLHALVRAYATPTDILRITVAGIADIAVAFVFGSVARGEADEQSDCDVFVVTAPGTTVDGKHAVVRALAVQTSDTSRALGREVSFVVYRLEDLQRRLAVPNGFASRVLTGSKLFVRGSDQELQSLLAASLDAAAHTSDQ